MRKKYWLVETSEDKLNYETLCLLLAIGPVEDDLWNLSALDASSVCRLRAALKLESHSLYNNLNRKY